MKHYFYVPSFCVPSPLFCLPPSPWFSFVFYFPSLPLCSNPCSQFPPLFSSPCSPLFLSLLVCCSLVLLLPPPCSSFSLLPPHLPAVCWKTSRQFFLESGSQYIFWKYFMKHICQRLFTHSFECVEGSSRKSDIAGGGCGLFF